jgi:hypothetical protein
MPPIFSSAVLDFYEKLNPPSNLPKGVDYLFPFSDKIVWDINKEFYHTYYNDSAQRTYLIGINPGRLGAGITGIPFTDPIRLKNDLGIENSFEQKAELSSKFIYDVIEALGGPHVFFKNFYFTSVSPIGFVKDGRNMNYYDDKELQNSLEDYILAQLETQLSSFSSNRNVAFCLGMGKNFKFLEKLNKQHGFFNEIIPLPHPRWVMQYRLKRKEEFVLDYQQKLIGEINN